MTGISSQEEADTLMILHAIEITGNWAAIDFYTQDTGWFVLILRRFELMGRQPRILTGTNNARRKVELTSIYYKIGPATSKALTVVHALTGSDTTGHINTVIKKRALKVVLKSDDDIVASLSNLGAENCRSEEIIDGCMIYLCMLVDNHKVLVTRDPGELRWRKFTALSSVKGMDKLPPTHGAWRQHILRAHMQARIWTQDIEQNPMCRIHLHWVGKKLMNSN